MKRRCAVALVVGLLLASPACARETSQPDGSAETTAPAVPRRPISAVVLAEPQDVGQPAVRTTRKIIVARLDGRTTTWTVSNTSELALSPDGRRLLYGKPAFRGSGFDQLRMLDLDSGNDRGVSLPATSSRLPQRPIVWGWDAKDGVIAVTAYEAAMDDGRPAELTSPKIWRGDPFRVSPEPLEVAADAGFPGGPAGMRLHLTRFIAGDSNRAYFLGTEGWPPRMTEILWRLDLASRRLVPIFIGSNARPHGPGFSLESPYVAVPGRVPSSAFLTEGIPIMRMTTVEKRTAEGSTIAPSLVAVDLRRAPDMRTIRSIVVTPAPAFGENRQPAFDETFSHYLEAIHADPPTSTIGRAPRRRIVEVDVATGEIGRLLNGPDPLALPLGYVDSRGSFVYRASAKDGVGVYLYTRPGGRKGFTVGESRLLTTLRKAPTDGFMRYDDPVLLGVQYAK